MCILILLQDLKLSFGTIKNEFCYAKCVTKNGETMYSKPGDEFVIWMDREIGWVNIKDVINKNKIEFKD